MDNINEQVKKVVCYSQNLNPNIVSVDDWIDKWREAKAWFIESFGGVSYTFDEKMSFELDDKEKCKRFEKFLSDIEYVGNGLAEFISWCGAIPFYGNRVPADYTLPDGVTILTGTKIVKAFKYFIDEERTLRYWQDVASRYIQEDKIEGYLTLSVDPLDFLSSSENAENWRSCHALDGDYRAGNVSYMLDSSTFMAYISSKELKKLPNFPDTLHWNSKKWRNLFFISNDRSMIFAGRPYPFESKQIIDKILSECIPAILHRSYSSWIHEYFKTLPIFNDSTISVPQTYYAVGSKLIPDNELIIDCCENPLYYNDLLHSTCYTPYYAYAHDWWNDSYRLNYACQAGSTKVNIGSPVVCCCCHKHLISNSSLFICNDCELEYGDRCDDDFGYCDCCGNHFMANDLSWDPDDNQYLCPSCYNERVAVCARCGEAHNIDNLYWNNEDFYCWGCLSEEERKKYIDFGGF